MQKLLENIGQTSDGAARQGFLAELHQEALCLKEDASHPELLLVGQMASALAGLLKQLTNKMGNVTASTLRPVASGVESLASLCQPGLKADLVNNPPLRFLVVDDDQISRMAVSFALKRALGPPDLAEHGEGALVLANQHAYDVIFLDVQMPRMDGFELCTRIHQTALNATTPMLKVGKWIRSVDLQHDEISASKKKHVDLCLGKLEELALGRGKHLGAAKIYA